MAENVKKDMKTKQILLYSFFPVLFAVVFFGFVNKPQSTMVASTEAMTEGEGIEFFHGTFSEAKAKAKSEGKLIFVDAYTTWCGPCRMMAAQTFPKAEVGKYFNANFVNVKMDMESGEGPAFGQQYKVMAYPTLLFLDHTGAVKMRAIGAKGPEDLINVGKQARAAQ